VWSLHVLLVSVWVPSGFSGFLLQSKDMQVNWTLNYIYIYIYTPVLFDCMNIHMHIHIHDALNSEG